MQQRTIGEPGEMVVVGQVVDVVGAAAMLGDVAAGNSHAIAQPDDLDIEPCALDHVVVDKDFADVGNAGADDFSILLDEAGADHEGTHFGEDLAVKAFARHAEAALGVGVDVAEAKVDDGAGGVGHAVEDVEVVEGVLGCGQKAGVLALGAGRGFAEAVQLREKNCGEHARTRQNPRCQGNGDPQRSCRKGKGDKDECGGGEDHPGRNG